MIKRSKVLVILSLVGLLTLSGCINVVQFFNPSAAIRCEQTVFSFTGVDTDITAETIEALEGSEVPEEEILLELTTPLYIASDASGRIIGISFFLENLDEGDFIDLEPPPEVTTPEEEAEYINNIFAGYGDTHVIVYFEPVTAQNVTFTVIEVPILFLYLLEFGEVDLEFEDITLDELLAEASELGYNILFQSTQLCGVVTINVGMIQISTSQAQPVYEDAGGGLVRVDGEELWLPQDYDQNGFDTYLVQSTEEVDGRVWVEISLADGYPNVWVPLDQVTPLRGIVTE